MKVPTKVINLVISEFSKLPPSPDRDFVLAWAKTGQQKRTQGALDAAQKLLEKNGMQVSASK